MIRDLDFVLIKIESQIINDIAYLESVIENAGECYDGQLCDIKNLQQLLKAITKYFETSKKIDKKYNRSD